MKKHLIRITALTMTVCCSLWAAPVAFADGGSEAFADYKPSMSESRAAVSMEANTLGLGFLIEPTMVNITDRAKASVVITDLLKENIKGMDPPWQMTGDIENAFYLSQVYCPDQKNAKVAEYIMDTLGKSGAQPNYAAREDVWLGEFDYFSMSGWMYSVGGNFPNVGAAAYTLKNSDVMRWQFTVYGYGADLNADNSEWGTASIVDSGNKDELTWLVAYLNSRFDKASLNKIDAYEKAMKILQDPQAKSADLSAAFGNLLKSCTLYGDISLSNEELAAVNRLTAWYLVNGTGDGNFEADALMTKPMVMIVLYRMAGSPAVSGNAAPQLGVQAGSAVTWAVEKGLIGSGDAAAMSIKDNISAADCTALANKACSVLTDKEAAAIKGKDGSNALSRGEAAEILAELHAVVKNATK